MLTEKCNASRRCEWRSAARTRVVESAGAADGRPTRRARRRPCLQVLSRHVLALKLFCDKTWRLFFPSKYWNVTHSIAWRSP